MQGAERGIMQQTLGESPAREIPSVGMELLTSQSTVAELYHSTTEFGHLSPLSHLSFPPSPLRQVMPGTISLCGVPAWGLSC